MLPDIPGCFKVLPSHRHGPAGHGGTTGVPEAGKRAGYTVSVPVDAGNGRKEE